MQTPMYFMHRPPRTKPFSSVVVVVIVNATFSHPECCSEAHLTQNVISVKDLLFLANNFSFKKHLFIIVFFITNSKKKSDFFNAHHRLDG
jgi:hypothetical protein